MSFTSKTSSLQAYHMLVYRGPLHPEFFKIENRRKLEHADYELESWIFHGGHVVRFHYDGQCITEVVSEHIQNLPEKNLETTIQCAGEKDHECEFSEELEYVTSMQTETLPEHLYLGTYNEMLEHGRTCDGLMTVWSDEHGKPNLSLLDVQRYNDEVHLQAYHLRSDCTMVLRTQTIFQVKTPSDA